MENFIFYTVSHLEIDTIFLQKLSQSFFFLTGFSVTHIHNSQDSRGNGRVSI